MRALGPMLLVAMAAARCAMAAETVYPGKSWTRKPPAAVGMDARKLAAFSEFTGGRGCVVRHGCLVHTWGDYKRRGDVASAAKPWYSHFLFKAIELGKLPSLDQKVAEWEPRLADINAALGHKDRAITFRHMANQTSCYGLVEKPGTAFCYNDWQMALFWDTLFLKVYGATCRTVDAKVLRPMLAGPLGCQDRPTFMAFGTRDRAGRLAVSPRDSCRFGLLYLRKGNWRGKQLIGRKHAIMAVTSPLPASLPRASRKKAQMIPHQRSIGSGSIPDNQCPHRGSYSFLWWLNGLDEKGRRLWPGVPTDAYGAFGHGGPRAMAVIPSLDLVVSWNDARLRGWAKVGKALRLLAEAVLVPSTGPAGKPRAGRARR